MGSGSSLLEAARSSRTFRRLAGWSLAWVVATLQAGPPTAPGGYWPSETWRTSSPEQQGLSSEVLCQALDQIRERNIEVDRILIVRHGYLVLDATFFPFAKDSLHDVASITKSITSLNVGIAIDRGWVKRVQVPVLSLFPERKSPLADEAEGQLNVAHLLTMTSGLCRDLREGEGQTGDMERARDGLSYMLDHALVAPPGRDFVYCSLGPHLLSAILTRVTGRPLKAFAEKELFAPLGISGVLWDADPQGYTHGWGDLFIRPMDLAKLGYLMLQGGRWDGKQIVAKAWVEASATPHVFESGGTGYGYLWWIPKEPAGLYEGRGRGGQRLAVWPRKHLVAVLLGSGGYTLGGIGATLIKAVVADEPLPENPPSLKRLHQKLAEAAAPPPAKPVAPPPPIATRVSGRTYTMEANRLGLKTFSLTFPGESEAELRLGSDEPADKIIPVGLDGVYRLSSTSRHGLAAGASGGWSRENTFAMAYREAAADRNWRFTIRFEGDAAVWAVHENTGLVGDFEIRARTIAPRGPASP
ncbi:serine hydrolase [Geothrix sp. 21YS21S-4]|uniref:serine hydrolase domain-containing protein n=1 Tax=Geothrix sp. 21YS21S-4 TaxID=3068889 RepID=UPI0027BA9326|nr:serine hydrolase [Geothrix sp. 21YS21S-4]